MWGSYKSQLFFDIVLGVGNPRDIVEARKVYKRKQIDIKLIIFLAVLFLVGLSMVSVAQAADPASVMNKWKRTLSVTGDLGGDSLSIEVVLYSAEYIEALVQMEADKNLWTQDEMEQYKYELLKTLQVDDYIPFFFKFNNTGPTMHMSPFGDHLNLWVGKNKFSPSDYDTRFNFALSGERDGFAFFPRYDEKTGESLLTGVKSIRLIIANTISPVLMSRSANNYDFIWDIGDDEFDELSKGSATDRLEADRLIKRLQKLKAEKAELETKLQENNDELAMIEARLAEIQSK